MVDFLPVCMGRDEDQQRCSLHSLELVLRGYGILKWICEQLVKLIARGKKHTVRTLIRETPEIGTNLNADAILRWSTDNPSAYFRRTLGQQSNLVVDVGGIISHNRSFVLCGIDAQAKDIEGCTQQQATYEHKMHIDR